MGEKPPTAVRRAANQNSLIASGNHTIIYYGNALVPKNQLYSSKSQIIRQPFPNVLRGGAHGQIYNSLHPPNDEQNDSFSERRCGSSGTGDSGKELHFFRICNCRSSCSAGGSGGYKISRSGTGTRPLPKGRIAFHSTHRHWKNLSADREKKCLTNGHEMCIVSIT